MVNHGGTHGINDGGESARSDLERLHRAQFTETILCDRRPTGGNQRDSDRAKAQKKAAAANKGKNKESGTSLLARRERDAQIMREKQAVSTMAGNDDAAGQHPSDIVFIMCTSRKRKPKQLQLQLAARTANEHGQIDV